MMIDDNIFNFKEGGVGDILTDIAFAPVHLLGNVVNFATAGESHEFYP